MLKIRLPAARIADALPLAGRELGVAGYSLAVGVPRVYPLEPRAALRARVVTIKHHAGDADDFVAAFREQLGRLPLSDDARSGLRVEVGRRRVLVVGGRKVIGFAVAIDGLDATSSLVLQCFGVGGRRHMGAGIFVPRGRRA